jgi:hypothetical protein
MNDTIAAYGCSFDNSGYAEGTDTTVYPGEYVTDELLGRKRAKESLIRLIEQIAVPFSDAWTADQPDRISGDTARAAIIFLRQLPLSVALPRISPDGEGSLAMLWENADPLLVTIDNWRVHMVEAATTGRAKYLDDVPFAAEIPENILRAILEH